MKYHICIKLTPVKKVKKVAIPIIKTNLWQQEKLKHK